MSRHAVLTAGVALLLLAPRAAWSGSVVEASKAALSTASPLATKAGLDVLRRGGNAMDAAVAVALALAVVHPQAGNLGGGGVLLYYEAASRGMWTLDFRETAPSGSKRDMFQLPGGEIAAGNRTGARAAGVPGTVAGLAAAHERFGSRPWKDVAAPSIALAREGIRIDSELHNDLRVAAATRHIDQFTGTAATFYPEANPAANGSTVTQRQLTATLERLAADPADFYRGETARRLVDAVKAGGGLIGDRDLRDYKPLWRAPLKIRFGEYEIYAPPPPSGGGLVLASALNILAGYDLAASGSQTALTTHLQAEAMRRAYIERNQVIGDPASTRIPLGQLLSIERAEQWRRSIDTGRATPTVTLAPQIGGLLEGTHTTHFTIVDQEGNIASLTTSLGENFGSGFLVPECGFFLNNAMAEFLPAPGKPDRSGLVTATPNAIEPGKRMASSLTPVIILKNGRPFLALGSRGGPAIPTVILQVFLNVAVHGMSLAEAVAAPRFHHQATPERLEFEQERPAQSLLAALSAMGHGIEPRDAIGDVHAVMMQAGRLVAVADPRRGGAAGGM